MATRILAAAHPPRVIEARGRFKGGSGMACTTVRARHYMVWLCTFTGGDDTVVTVHTLLSSHFRTTVIEGPPGKRRRCWRITNVANYAITRGWHMVLRLPGCIHSIMTGRTGKPVVYASHIQCRVVEARGKTATGLMAILAHIRRRRVRPAFADGFNRTAVDMATYARLGLNGWILVIDRIGFLEITCRGVTCIAIPTIRINGVMHRIRRMALGKIDRIVV